MTKQEKTFALVLSTLGAIVYAVFLHKLQVPWAPVVVISGLIAVIIYVEHPPTETFTLFFHKARAFFRGRGVYGLELLTLDEIDTRSKCQGIIAQEKEKCLMTIAISLFLSALFILPTAFAIFLSQSSLTLTDALAYATLIFACSMPLLAAIGLYRFSRAIFRIRYGVLLPAYWKNKVAKTNTTFVSEAKALEGELPRRDYRTAHIPETTRESLDALRRLVDDRRLPAKLEPQLVRVETARAKLEEAELESVESEASSAKVPETT